MLTLIIVGTGYLGLIATVFLESGTVVGLILPGDSLLFTAGFLASQHVFSIQLLLLLLIPAGILGDIVGYATGKAFGPRLFSRPESKFFNPRYIREAETFFERYGARAILLARFMPVIRCFIPMVAGAARMKYSGFLLYNVLGSVIWVGLLTLMGYFLGRSIPNADKYLLPVVALIITISMLPAVIQFLKMRKRSIQKDTPKV